jgi:hypothetical protein
MKIKSQLFVGLFLSASVTASVLAGETWQVLVVVDGSAPASISGVKGAVWVPNSLNNPVIDQDGFVTFRGTLAGAGITATGANANHIVVVTTPAFPATRPRPRSSRAREARTTRSRAPTTSPKTAGFSSPAT